MKARHVTKEVKTFSGKTVAELLVLYLAKQVAALSLDDDQGESG